MWEVKQCDDQREDVLEFRREGYRMLEPNEVHKRIYLRNKAVFQEIHNYFSLNTCSSASSSVH